MRSITTDYNNAAFYSATKFTDTETGNGFTVAANNPVNVRALNDSVSAGSYVASATSIELEAATLTPAPDAVVVFSVTAKISTTATAGIPVKASSSDPTKVTVSPSVARADATGVAKFTITAVGEDTEAATLTFATYGATNQTCAVTITA